MEKLTKEQLYSLEKYAEVRPDFRKKVMEHKNLRSVQIGENAYFHFEDRLTMQYQVQEMLRIEKIFEAKGIEEELDAYNPLIPDGTNWKATFMIQYEDPEVRKQELTKLIGIEDKVWVKVNDNEKVYAIADEDLERENEVKTSSVHFLRFELEPDMIDKVKKNAEITIGIDHENYNGSVEANPNLKESLKADLN